MSKKYKTEDTELLHFIEEQGAGSRTVIVEADLPEPQVEITNTRSPRPHVRFIGFPDARDEPVFQRLGQRLQALVGETVPLPASHAYAVEATAEQLEELSNYSEVKRLSPSRTRDGEEATRDETAW